MKFFISAEKTPYFFWQLEILIESFRLYGLQDNLIIALAEDNKNKYLPKLLSKSNVFIHENHGRNIGYLPFNKPLSVLAALRNNVLKQPFMLIDPDFILKNTEIIEPKTVASSKQFCMQLDEIRKFPWPIDEAFEKFSLDASKWKPCGASYYFKNVPMEVFEDVPVFIQKCAEISPSWWCIEMIAWICSFIKNNIDIEEIQYEEMLTDSNNNNFIHYFAGVPNFFSKHDYREIPANCLSCEPYNKILSLNPEISTSVKYIQKIIKSYLTNT